MKLFSSANYWGRYLLFVFLSLPFSLINLFVENPEYPNAASAFFFNYFGAQLMYWALYILISLQFMMANNSQFSFRFYKNSAVFILGLVSVSLIGINVFHALNDGALLNLVRVPMGLAFAFAGYNLYLEKTGKSSGI